MVLWVSEREMGPFLLVYLPLPQKSLKNVLCKYWEDYDHDGACFIYMRKRVSLCSNPYQGSTFKAKIVVQIAVIG